jgi:TolB protein
MWKRASLLLAPAAVLTVSCSSAIPTVRLIAFVTTRDGNTEIYTMRGDGSNQTNITNDPGSDVLGDVSPDGKKIVFTSSRFGQNELFVMNVDGTNVVRLTNNPADDIEPSWASSNEFIYFATNRNGTYDLFRMKTDGTTPTAVTTGPANDTSPSCDPRMRYLAFVSDRDGNNEIYRVDIDGSSILRLTVSGAADASPAWSAGGGNILWVVAGQIWVMEKDGTLPAQYYFGAGTNVDPEFSRTGSQILFVTDRSGSPQIHRMFSNLSSETVLTSGGTSNALPRVIR